MNLFLSIWLNKVIIFLSPLFSLLSYWAGPRKKEEKSSGVGRERSEMRMEWVCFPLASLPLQLKSETLQINGLLVMGWRPAKPNEAEQSLIPSSINQLYFFIDQFSLIYFMNSLWLIGLNGKEKRNWMSVMGQEHITNNPQPQTKFVSEGAAHNSINSLFFSLISFIQEKLIWFHCLGWNQIIL